MTNILIALVLFISAIQLVRICSDLEKIDRTLVSLESTLSLIQVENSHLLK